MSLHARASQARIVPSGSKMRLNKAKAGEDWAWSHISAAQHAGAMALQQTAGNAFVAQTMGASTRGGAVAAAPALTDDEEPVIDENASEEQVEDTLPEEEPIDLATGT